MLQFVIYCIFNWHFAPNWCITDCHSLALIKVGHRLTFIARAPRISDEVVVDHTLYDVGDVADGRQQPQFAHDALGSVAQQLLSVVRRHCVAARWLARHVSHAGQLERQVDDVRLRRKTDEIVDVIKTVHHVVRDAAVPEVVLQLEHCSTVGHAGAAIQNIHHVLHRHSHVDKTLL